jgi:dipeptidyl aminopeptidase/acylaminoacyl peptidase
VYAAEDKVVPSESSMRLYNALRKNAVSAELHLYTNGEHGFLTKPSFDEWFGRCVNWMRDMSIIHLVGLAIYN